MPLDRIALFGGFVRGIRSGSIVLFGASIPDPRLGLVLGDIFSPKREAGVVVMEGVGMMGLSL
jgi:hypothetical protein